MADPSARGHGHATREAPVSARGAARRPKEKGSIRVLGAVGRSLGDWPISSLELAVLGIALGPQRSLSVSVVPRISASRSATAWLFRWCSIMVPGSGERSVNWSPSRLAMISGAPAIMWRMPS